jgi:hypothetical protein
MGEKKGKCVAEMRKTGIKEEEESIGKRRRREERWIIKENEEN